MAPVPAGKAWRLGGDRERRIKQSASLNLDERELSVVHLLSGLVIGGKERAALRLAERGLAGGGRHALWLFDTPFRSTELDFAPGPVPTHFLPRGSGLDLAFIRTLAHELASTPRRK